MHDHHHSTAPRSEHVMLELGADVGALVLYTGQELHGAEVEIAPAGSDGPRAHKQVHERLVADRTFYAAVFDRLPAGEYALWLDGAVREPRVAVTGAAVSELDWRPTPTLQEEHG
jgi:hypothetical protein